MHFMTFAVLFASLLQIGWVSWITLRSRILFYQSSSSFFPLLFVRPAKCALEIVRKSIHISAKDFSFNKVKIINSFIGSGHETAGVLLIFISAFLWALGEGTKRVCGPAEAIRLFISKIFFRLRCSRTNARALSFVTNIFSCRTRDG